MSIADCRPIDSMSIDLKEGTQLMTIYTPYFYIIQDIRDGMYYAGAKWAYDAHPDNFMVEGGYETSSNTIKELISQYGLCNFIIRRIKIFVTGNEAYNYETRFLRKINAAAHPRFYNKHNNERPSFGSDEFKNIMLEKYGVEHYSETAEHLEKRIETNLKKYGVEHGVQCEAVKNKIIESNLKKYGETSYTKTDEFKEKMKKTNLERYGHENYLHSEAEIEKLNELYGVSSHSQRNDVKSKIEKTNLERRGVACAFQCEIVKGKIKNTNMERYGETHYNKTKQGRKNLSDKNPFKGKEGFFKGRSHTEESRRKIRESSIGREKSLETREKLSKANTGKKMSTETKKKISDNNQKRVEDGSATFLKVSSVDINGQCVFVDKEIFYAEKSKPETERLYVGVTSKEGKRRRDLLKSALT